MREDKYNLWVRSRPLGHDRSIGDLLKWTSLTIGGALLMPDPHITIGPITTQTYSVMLGIGILSAMALMVITYRLRYIVPFSKLVDVSLVALIAGAAGARLFHVILNWYYFQDNTTEIAQLGAGGLNWHGAVIGVLLVLIVATVVFRLSLSSLLDSLAVPLPLLAFMAWWGCGAATCSFGAEVESMTDYPAWLTWEAPGQFQLVAPRFATQPIGMVLSGALLMLMAIVVRQGRCEGRQFWVALALLSLEMLWLDSMRGDYATVIGTLRGDQWLDLAMCMISLLVWTGIAWGKRSDRPTIHGLQGNV